jgi:hypothetical protein
MVNTSVALSNSCQVIKSGGGGCFCLSHHHHRRQEPQLPIRTVPQYRTGSRSKTLDDLPKPPTRTGSRSRGSRQRLRGSSPRTSIFPVRNHRYLASLPTAARPATTRTTPTEPAEASTASKSATAAPAPAISASDRLGEEKPK